jgi:hypothetical protein
MCAANGMHSSSMRVINALSDSKEFLPSYHGVICKGI